MVGFFDISYTGLPEFSWNNGRERVFVVVNVIIINILK